MEYEYTEKKPNRDVDQAKRQHVLVIILNYIESRLPYEVLKPSLCFSKICLNNLFP
jgi:hypothetical protein